MYKRFHTSFAKSGVDLQVYQLLKQKVNGFYIDIGAHHPIKANNTYFFYLKGWRGICIDPNPQFIPLYKQKRPGDIFMNIGISNSDKAELNYYKLRKELSARNSFSEEYINTNNLIKDVESILSIKVKKLKDVLDEVNRKNVEIDFLTIDCEGLDFEVLKSNNWELYRPMIVCIESHQELLDDLSAASTQFMNSVGYTLVGKTMQGKYVGTLFYLRK